MRLPGGEMTGKQRRQLRALAHALKPVVIVGQRGLNDAVVSQTDGALTVHELIKVKLSSESPVDREEAAELFRRRLGCEVAGIVGRVLILYRADPENPKIRLLESAAGSGAKRGRTEELGGSDDPV